MNKNLLLLAMGALLGAVAVYLFVAAVPAEPVSTETASTENVATDTALGFEIDISSLTYDLPYYDRICIPDSKQFCTEAGCEAVPAGVFLLLDNGDRGSDDLIYRCDNNPCDEYVMDISKSAGLTNYQARDGRGYIVKMSTTEYVEVATLGTDTYISYGTCQSRQ